MHPILKQLLTYFFTLLVAFSLYSCSEYSKVLKSDDPDYKLKMANQYYEAGDYEKALSLYEELIALYRGSNESQEIYFRYANSHFQEKDYYLAGYYFNNFQKTYPSSDRAEKAMFLSAYCSYKNSPTFSLDQTDTYNAIDEFELFLDRYPNSSKQDTVMSLLSELRDKLETKAYNSAKLYYKIEDYKSAVVALNNVLEDYPASEHREEISFLIVKANYKLAINSVTSKKEQRLNDTIESYFNFVDRFENSEYISTAESYYQDALESLEAFKAAN